MSDRIWFEAQTLHIHFTRPKAPSNYHRYELARHRLGYLKGIVARAEARFTAAGDATEFQLDPADLEWLAAHDLKGAGLSISNAPGAMSDFRPLLEFRRDYAAEELRAVIGLLGESPNGVVGLVTLGDAACGFLDDENATDAQITAAALRILYVAQLAQAKRPGLPDETLRLEALKGLRIRRMIEALEGF